MRLEPIEKPKSWILKLAYHMSRRQMGRVAVALGLESDELVSLALQKA